ncbi:UbiA family prenyltransferase [Acidobacteriota bacterium]
MYFSVIFGGIFFLIFYFLNVLILILAAASFLGWICYYIPRYGLKNFPITGTLIHVFTQVIHFQMGYSLFQKPSWNSIVISFYFALLWGGAYLNHELIDYESDKQAEIKTSAVVYGKTLMDRWSYILFVVANFYLVFIVLIEQLGSWMAYPFIAAFILQTLTKIYFTWFKPGTIVSPIHYRNLYRIYYSIGAVFFVFMNFYSGVIRW